MIFGARSAAGETSGGLDGLLQRLHEIDRSADARWVDGLEARKRAEIEHADAHRSLNRAALDPATFNRLYGNLKYHAAHEKSQRYFDGWLARHAPGRVVLDYCCGDGANAIKAARLGASLAIGIDISRVSVDLARAYAKRAGVSTNTRFVRGDAERTGLPDDSVDVAICCGVLHHLDLSFALPELRRVLRPGGRLIAIEALDYNPIIRLYRAMTPEMRTAWEREHILDLGDVRFARRFLELGELRYWHLSSILGVHFRPIAPALNALDAVLTRIPGVQLMSKLFTFELRKPAPTG